MFFYSSGAPLAPRGANRTTRWRSYAGKMAVGAVKFRFWTERNEIGRPRRPFYLHMSAIGWSDLPPEGSKGALEGPKSFKFLRARGQTTVFYHDFGVDRPPGQDFAPLRAKTCIWCRPQHPFRKTLLICRREAQNGPSSP